ncbi:MAG: DUF481 domain-containing protein [bacterium]|nr:DUF481 domain-containing protein [bacterium]
MQRSFSAALLLFCALLLTQPVWAIVSVEQERFKPLKPGIQGSASVDLGQDRGNLVYDEWGGDAAVRFGAEEDREYMVLASRYYASSEGHKLDDTIWLHLRAYQPTDGVMGYEAFFQAQSNAYLLVKRRIVAGGGLRFRLNNDPGRYSHHLGAGLFDEQESYADPVDPNNDHNLRGNFYWSLFYKIKGGPEIGNVYYLQPALGGGDDIRSLDQFSLKWALDEQLSLKINIDWSNDTEPLTGLKTTDTSSSLSFSIDF